VRLIPPAYVKPFVKRQKNDTADAEAICEAAQRPSMRSVPVKSEEQQANGVVFRKRRLIDTIDVLSCWAKVCQPAKERRLWTSIPTRSTRPCWPCFS